MQRKSVVIVPVDYVKITPFQFPLHLQRQVISIVSGKTFKPPDKDTVYFLFFRKLSGRITGEDCDGVVSGQSLAHILNVLFDAAYIRIVLMTNLKHIHTK
jgi:hypothetical protein